MRLIPKATEVRKRCIECGERLPLSSFHKTSGRSADGHRNVCKSCRRATEAARIREKRNK